MQFLGVRHSRAEHSEGFSLCRESCVASGGVSNCHRGVADTGVGLCSSFSAAVSWRFLETVDFTCLQLAILFA